MLGGNVAVFLEKGICRFFPLLKIEADHPLYDCLKPVRRGEEELALWGLETHQKFKIKTIHQWMNEKCPAPVYIEKRNDHPYRHLLAMISTSEYRYFTDLIILDRTSYIQFVQEMKTWDEKDVQNEVIQRILNRTLRVDFSSYANKDEILLLNRNEFQILLGYDMEHNQLLWNLVMFDGSKNRKIIMTKGAENGTKA